jgi:hypothetical protein
MMEAAGRPLLGTGTPRAGAHVIETSVATRVFDYGPMTRLPRLATSLRVVRHILNVEGKGL